MITLAPAFNVFIYKTKSFCIYSSIFFQESKYIRRLFIRLRIEARLISTRKAWSTAKLKVLPAKKIPLLYSLLTYYGSVIPLSIVDLSFNHSFPYCFIRPLRPMRYNTGCLDLNSLYESKNSLLLRQTQLILSYSRKISLKFLVYCFDFRERLRKSTSIYDISPSTAESSSIHIFT